LVGIDPLAWTGMLLFNGEHALAEPKKVRYRRLHVAARITRTADEPTSASLKRGHGQRCRHRVRRHGTLPRPLA
jgi:hypothetical protein